ncbi:ABC transporter substrate-binding protein, partial [Campylobacter jejuni]|nr:ABC transporter substrate-binding protein [Campylobacter jejuni]
YKENSKLTGFDTDLVEEIAKKNGIKIVWVETNFDGLIPALKAGKIDMIASAMSATDKRRQSVDFTKPYYMSKNLYLKLKNNDSLQTKNDLEGKKIGVQLGTLQENTAKAIKNAQVQSNKDLNIAVLALKNNKIDAIVADQDTAKGFLAENPELVSFYQETDGGEGFSFAFDKNKQKDIIEIFNKGIDEAKTDGFYDTLIKKYELE